MTVKVKPSVDGPNLSGFLKMLNAEVNEERDGWITKCPAHDDHQASLRITVSEKTGKVLIKDRAGCRNIEVMAALGLTLKDLAVMAADISPTHKATSIDVLPDDRAIASLQMTLDAYSSALHTKEGQAGLAYAAQRFGIEPDDARRLGLGYTADLGGGPRLVVPFKNLAGRAEGYQARALNSVAQVRWSGPSNPDGAAWSRVGFFRGASGWPEVIITEGPGDALTAVATGYDAIGVRGAGLANNEATIELLADMLQDRIAVVAGDGDAAGRRFSAAIAGGLTERGITVKTLKLADGKDLTDWRADDPTWFRQGFIKRVKELGETSVADAKMSEWDEDVYALTDVGAARFLRDKLSAEGRAIRFTEATGFLQLELGVWNKKSDAQIRTEVQSIGDVLKHLAFQAQIKAKETLKQADVNSASRFTAYSLVAQSSRGIDAIMKELRSVAGVYASVEDFDRHLFYLAVRNGVVDLRTKELLPHDPAYLLTKRIDYDYNPEAQAPRWLRFLNEIFPDQPDMPAYVQRLIGYGITGSTDEQCFVVLYGTGSNGKSLLIDTLSEIFKSITTTTPFSTFEQRASGGIPNDVAALANARLVMASEGEQGKLMAEAVLKRLTGRDMVTARFLNREFFTFRPQFLLLMASNYKPAFKGQDDGLWRRVKLLEFRRQFKKADQEAGLDQRLLAEAEGILAWAIEGAYEWVHGGLREPAAITQTTDEFRVQSDVLTGFLPGKYEAGDGWIARTELFREFQDWADEENFLDLARWSSRAFYRSIEERGYVTAKRDGVMGFKGIVLHDPDAAKPAKLEVATAPAEPLRGPTAEDFLND